MRARMALLIAGVAFDAHEVSLRSKPADMLAPVTERYGTGPAPAGRRSPRTELGHHALGAGFAVVHALVAIGADG
jgi:hypothetical protein